MVAICGDNYHTLHKIVVYEAISDKIGNKFDNKCEYEFMAFIKISRHYYAQ